MFTAHLRNMFLYFILGTLSVLVFGIGLTPGDNWAMLVLSLVLVPASTIVLAITATMQLRQRLSLMQTGRFIQWGAFYLSALLALWLFSLAGAITLSNGWLAALVLFAISFGAATAFGEVPWRGRTWLPMRMPGKK
jgi:Na+/melibiose symporter-like transporter